MADYTRDVKKLLINNGCKFIRHGKGDHSTWYSHITNRYFTVDGAIADRHTANGIMQQAGIKHKF
jgi:predicted RNA binding protein YcfA (HicA-like mRNA interferase family)